jgi:uncharacterized protein (DUF697 family)
MVEVFGEPRTVDGGLSPERLTAMDALADEAIRKWSFGALGANLLPPPFDMMAVGSVFAGMGAKLSKIYEVDVGWNDLKLLGTAIAKGVGAVLLAFQLGTGLFKYIPGVNVWVALLVQPPIVAAVAYSAGHAFKEYFHVRITEGRDLSPEQARALAEAALRAKLSGRFSSIVHKLT